MKTIFLLAIISILPACSTQHAVIKLSIQDVEPWVFSGERQGIAENFVSQLNALDEDKALQITMTAKSLTDTKKDLNTGSADIAVLHNGHTIPETAVPILKITNVPIIALMRKDTTFDGIESLRKKKIAYWKEDEDLLDLSNYGEKLSVENHRMGIKALEKKEVSVFIAAMNPINLALSKSEFDPRDFNRSHIIGRYEAWLYFSSKSPHLSNYDRVKKKVQTVLQNVDSKLMR